MTHEWWWLAVDALAALRLTLLVSRDTITAPAREWVRDRAYDERGLLRSFGWKRAFDLIICVWCTSVWVAAVVVALTKFIPGAWEYAAMGLALSAVAGLLGDR